MFQDIRSICKNQLNFYTTEQSKNGIKPTISITLNVNKLNNPIKRQKLSDCINKHDRFNYMLSVENIL